MSERKTLSSKDRKQLARQRKSAAKQAQKFHREQEKKAKKSSATAKKSTTKKRSSSKIEEAVNSGKTVKFENISREEKYMRESEERIRNLEPQDFDDGYYIDEYGARQKQERRAKEIHQQENEVIHRRKKPITQKQLKIRRILIYSSIFAAVLVIGVVLSLTVLFKTEKIEVEGDKYYYEDQIIAFSGVELQQNIIVGAFSSTPENISANLPYVEKAEISFSIPDTITIKITDAVPSYVIKNGDKYLLISSKGRILDSIDSNEDKLPELKCDKLKSTKAGDYVSFNDENVPDILEDVSESLNANDVKNITAFDVTDTANITLEYDKRITINIGLPEDIDYKIRTAMMIINEKLDPNNTGTIAGKLDVSSCNTTKVSRYKPAETAPPTTVPATTAPADYSDGNQYYDDSYTWSDNTYSDGSYYDGGYADNGTNNYGEPYDSNTYSDDGTSDYSAQNDYNAYGDAGDNYYQDNYYDNGAYYAE